MDQSFGIRRMPTGASLFSAYASLSATFTLIQQAIYQFVPPAVREYVYDLLRKLFVRSSPSSPDLFTLIIEERSDGSRNEVFDACQIYLCNRMNESANMLKVSRAPNEETMSFKLAKGVKFSETFEEIDLEWSFHCAVVSDNAFPSNQPPVKPVREMKNQGNEKYAYFSLRFNKEHKKEVCNSYLPFVVETSKDIGREGKVLKLADCTGGFGMPPPRVGKSKSAVNMTHPFTFEKLAMDPEIKKWIVDDLDRFVKRKEFYRRVGKPWKRGYLLHGPPGTGKSSLIAAMANHLKFDIYDLQLGSIYNHSSLRDMLLWLPSESIIVIEDIDRTQGIRKKLPKKKFELNDESDDSDDDRAASDLAPLLNFVDGLWSCCGDERLIVFTTNHKEKLDPALLRPGRMDMHIHMSYLTMPGFKVLAGNYLQANEHRLFGEIERLLKTTNATPAEVAEELMRSEDVDIALNGVIELLKGKLLKIEDAELRENGDLIIHRTLLH